MKNYLVLLALLPLVSCSQLNVLEVTDTENAMVCVKGKTNPLPALGGTGIMVDVGKTDTTNYTAADWKELAEICD